MKVIFRVDASRQIGSGHVTRCLTLAKYLRVHGAECQFICRIHQGCMHDYIRQEGFEVFMLPLGDPYYGEKCEIKRSPSHMQWLGVDWLVDAHESIEVLSGQGIDWLVVDHYALDFRWETALSPYCKKIMVIDDLADRNHNCNLLLDQNLVASYLNRYDELIPKECIRLLGPKYALLQSEYAEMHLRAPSRRQPIQHVLVFFGGADENNVTSMAISAINDLKRRDISVSVVIGDANLHAAKISELARDNPNISLHQIFPSLAPLMMKADLAIGAGGATSWERCCLGLPSLVVTLAENQMPIAAELSRKGLIKWVGHYNNVSAVSLREAFSEVLQDSNLEKWSINCKRLVDGNGTTLVANFIMLTADTLLNIRAALLEDEELILRWANDPLVRQQAFSQELINADVHKNWFSQRLRDAGGCKIYIIETDGRLPIGQVRFERVGEQWEVHYCLDAIARGRGLGKKLLQVAIKKFKKSDPGAQFFGRVKKDNYASQKIFKGLNFLEEFNEGENVYRHP